MNTHPRTPSFTLSSKAPFGPRPSLGRLRDVSVQVAQLPRTTYKGVGGGYRGNNNHAKEQHADDAFYGDVMGMLQTHVAIALDQVLAGAHAFEVYRKSQEDKARLTTR